MRFSRRELIAGSAGILVSSQLFAAQMLQAAGVDPYAAADPQLRPALLAFKRADLSEETLAIWRGAVPRHPAVALPAPAPQLQRRTIAGLPGEPPVTVIIVDPSPSKRDRPAFLYLHGGGFVMFGPDRNPALLQQIAMDSNCLVVAVDYRLAPETRFPGALHDNYAALKWLHANAAELGIDRARIAIGGESAGGSHAAMLAIAARDRGEVPVAFQLLIYPALDDRTGSVVHVAPPIGQFIWTEASNRFGWTALLGVRAGSPTVPEGAVPARVADLNGLPPTFIGVGALDLFVDEDIAFARRLVAANVPTELRVEPGAYHGFDLSSPTADVSIRFTAAWRAALRKALVGR